MIDKTCRWIRKRRFFECLRLLTWACCVLSFFFAKVLSCDTVFFFILRMLTLRAAFFFWCVYVSWQTQCFCRPCCPDAIREGGFLGREGGFCLGAAGEGLIWVTSPGGLPLVFDGWRFHTRRSDRIGYCTDHTNRFHGSASSAPFFAGLICRT